MEYLYKENLLDHYRNPRNHGKMMNPHIHKEDSNPLCGDVIEIFVRVKNGKVDSVSFEGKGCVISQATASMLTDELKGKTLAEVQSLERENILDLIGLTLTPTRVKCAMLPLMTIKKGIIEYESKKK
jgi:nitrogen fixation protein NifU and related proteins